MAGVLVFSEREGLALELLTGGCEIGAARGVTLSVALLGPGGAARAAGCFAHGAQRAYVAADAGLAEFREEILAATLAYIVAEAGADLVLIGSTRRGRALAPRLAQKLGAGCVTDAKSVNVRDGRVVTTRLALGGNTLKEEAIVTDVAVVAVAPGTFDGVSVGGEAGEMVAVTAAVTPSRAVTIEHRAKRSGAVNIEDADRLVCVGRGIASRDDLPLIEALARALGAEVAATRPVAYELKWMSEDRMVGISGKTVAPQLYVVVGSSGQIQHTVSIRDSKVIVAINKDKNAPIFGLADYGIVGDLYEIVPRLTAALANG